jgi:hypothetical protein
VFQAQPVEISLGSSSEKIVEDDDVVSLLNGAMGEVAADKAGTTCNHHTLPAH